MQNKCKVCDIYFAARRSNETLCSEVCKKIHKNRVHKKAYKKGGYKKVAATEKPCIICNEVFSTTNNMQKCCSYECSDVNRRTSARKLHDSGRYRKTEEKKLPTIGIDPKFILPRGSRQRKALGLKEVNFSRYTSLNSMGVAG